MTTTYTEGSSMDTETRSLEDFIAARRLEMTVEAADGNPFMDRADTMKHYTVTISHEDGQSMQVVYSMGSGLQGPPELARVLETLADDIASIENAQGFNDWATEMGYFPMEAEEDLERARAAYEAIEDQQRELGLVLGPMALEELLWNVERS